MYESGEFFAGSGGRIDRLSFTLKVLLQNSGLVNEFRAGGNKPSSHVIGPRDFPRNEHQRKDDQAWENWRTVSNCRRLLF